MTFGLIIVTSCYIVLNLVVGLLKLRRSSYDEFVACPSSINKYAIALSICGTVIGGGMFFTVAQMGYEAGFAVLALPASYIVGYLLLSLAIPAIRKTMSSPEINTLYDVVSVRLPAREGWTTGYRVLLSFVTFGMYFFMLSAQFTIIANFYVAVLGVTPTGSWLLSLLVIGGTTLLYSVAGGIRKDIATDVFQVVIVFVGLVVLGLAMICGRGLSFTNVPASHFTFTGYGVFFPIGVLLFFSPSFVGRYDFWQRIIAAKSTSEARFALWLSLPMIIAAYIVCCLIGICARSMSPSTDSAHAAIWFMREALPGGLSLVVTLAFYAALMATSDTLLGVSAVSFSSIAQTVLSSHRKSLRTVTFIRCVTVLVGVGASATVLLAADTVDLIIGGFSSLVILTPGLLFVLLNRAPSALVACASLFFGYGSFLTAFLLVPPYRKYAFILGFLIACAAVGVGHLASRILPRRAEAHDRT